MTTRIGIVGVGNIGRRVARWLDAGKLPDAALTAVCVRDAARAEPFLATLAARPAVLSLSDLCASVDIVVESATAAAFPDIAYAALGAGRSFVAVSSAGIPRCSEFIEMARSGPGRVRIASGAMPGLDSIRSLAEGKITAARQVSTVLPSSFSGESVLAEKGIDPDNPGQERVLIFEGTATQAALAFPRHFNVAIALGLAGVPLDLLTIQLWMDPTLKGPTVHVVIEGEDGTFEMISRNIPSPDNPRTSRIIAPSVMAALRAMVVPLQAGS